jgi:type I restriction enzyme S subunit
LPGRFQRVYVEEGQGRVFIGGKQIYELDPYGKKYLSLTHHGDRIKKQLELAENMTLITCSGTIGKATLVPRHWSNWAASQHIIRVVPANADMAGYLAVFLASNWGRQLITRFTYGSVVDEVDNHHVSKIPFPLLKNAAAQAEINRLALKASELRYQAYELERDAMDALENDVLSYGE